MDEKRVCNFIFELGMLKRIKHEGWRIAGVNELDSVAAHSLRAAQIGFILARMEGYGKPEEVCAMVVFHDNAECRTGDVHKVANRYVKRDEFSAMRDQTAPLEDVGKQIYDLWDRYEKRESPAGVIAKDADWLEIAFSGKEYVEQGYAGAQDWIENVSRALKTKSAKRLMEELRKSNSNDWWQGLKKIG